MGSSATLIDNIFTNDHINLNTALKGILVTDISDHYPVFYVDQPLKEIETDIWISKRKYSVQNKTKFNRALSSVDWIRLCDDNNTNNSFELFHNKLRELHNQYFSITKIKKEYNNRKPWLTEGLRSSIKTKNKLYSKYKKVDSVANETIYKSY